jgi:mannose-6-phosphate isomerase-like protein (cupin superfamily)
MLDTMEDIFVSGRDLSVEEYSRLEDISIDYAIMEKTSRGIVLPSSFGWSDIGSWKALYDFLPKDAEQNVIDGDVITQKTRSCFISGFERLIATNRISNLVIVETPDSIFVSDIDHSRDVKSIVQELKQKNRRETRLHRKAFHPWGTSTLLDDNPKCRIERVEVYPGAFWRSTRTADATQHLTVVRGTAELVTGGKTVPLKKNDTHSFSGQGRVHIENIGGERLQLVHIQIGG